MKGKYFFFTNAVGFDMSENMMFSVNTLFPTTHLCNTDCLCEGKWRGRH